MRLLLVTLAAFLLAPTGMAAQRSQGNCPMWSPIPGVSSNVDTAYNRCQLDRPPVLRASTPMPRPPQWDRRVRGSFQVIVNADGAVDPTFTRIWSTSGRVEFYDSALQVIRGWHFEPGVRRGTPVRNGFRLEVQSSARVDTLPARLQWSYRQGDAEADTLVGTWTVEAPLPPFGIERTDSVYAAMLRHLVAMQVVTPGGGQRYCIAAADDHVLDPARLSRLASAIGYPTAAPGCARSLTARRIVLPRVYRTEDGRAVLYPSGDYLPSWPNGLDGRSWRVWSGRCVANVPARGPVRHECDVSPRDEPEERVESTRPRRPLAARAPSGRPGDSVRISVYVTTREARWVDTLTAVVAQLPRLWDRAVVDAETPGYSWSFHSPQNGAKPFVLSGDPADNSLHITDASPTRAPAGSARSSTAANCGPPVPRPCAFVAFLLGDVGDAATEPITLCFSGCSKRYVLDPARHTLAKRAHLRFRLSELREGTRSGDQLIFRIRVDRPARTSSRSLSSATAAGGSRPRRSPAKSQTTHGTTTSSLKGATDGTPTCEST